jgi:ABC-2 type transport system ATP-binding protein
MVNAAIEIQGLEKTFRTGLRRRRAQALCGLDLRVEPGELFGFLGPNGAGKTTTIKILVGLLRASAGRAELFGLPVSEPRARARVAYLPELPDFYDYLTPGEFLRHVGQLQGLAPGLLARRVPEILARVGLEPGERRAMRKFSKGMLQRVGIGQTLLGDPDLLIWDEPMSGLDPLGRRWVKDLLLELGQQGKTVFFSSHILAEAEAICSRVAFIHRGRLVRQGPLAEVLQEESGGFEIVLEGQAALGDPAVVELGGEARAAGPDCQILLPAGRPPEPLLAHLAAAGGRVRSAQRRHRSLEDVFVEQLGARKEG